MEDNGYKLEPIPSSDDDISLSIFKEDDGEIEDLDIFDADESLFEEEEKESDSDHTGLILLLSCCVGWIVGIICGYFSWGP